jgi:hypothetical protein
VLQGRSESRQGRSETEEFSFPQENPHNVPARKFALKAEEQGEAIHCDCTRGPCFGNCDICVFGHCNASTRSGSDNDLGNSYSDSWLGLCYANDTGLDEWKVITGLYNFTMKEIEVF